MSPPDVPEDFRRSLTDWSRRPPGASAAEARRRVAARLRPEVARPTSRLLAAAAAVVTLAGVWLAARADRFHEIPPPSAPQVSEASPPMVVMRLSSGTTLYVTLPSKP